MTFEVISKSNSARLGTWTINCNTVKQSNICTPICLLHTQKGAPPHLTMDNLQHCGNTSAENKSTTLPPAHIFYSNCGDNVLRAKLFKQEGITLAQYLNLTTTPLVMSICDPLQPLLEDNTNAAGFNVDVGTGRSKVSVKEYFDNSLACSVNVIESPYDRTAPNCATSRHTKSTKRSQGFLTEFVNNIKKSKTEDESASTSVNGHAKNIQYFASIVGGDSIVEREKSVQHALAEGSVFAGFSIRNIPTAGPKSKLVDVLQASLVALPENKLRMLSGWGEPEMVLRAVGLGVDVFDGSYPYVITELGCALQFWFEGMRPEPVGGVERSRAISLYDTAYGNDHTPLVEGCTCFTCEHHTRSYIHHLLLTHEMLAQVLLMMHNVHHYWDFFNGIRTSIQNDLFDGACDKFFHNM
eukprot:CFRG7947T1